MIVTSRWQQGKGTHWVSYFIDRNAVYFLISVKIAQITLKILKINIFLKMHWTKSKKNTPLATHLEYNLVILLCIFYSYHRIPACRKNVVRLYQLFSPDDYPKNNKIRYENYKDKHGKRKHKPWL